MAGTKPKENKDKVSTFLKQGLALLFSLKKSSFVIRATNFQTDKTGAPNGSSRIFASNAGLARQKKNCQKRLSPQKPSNLVRKL